MRDPYQAYVDNGVVGSSPLQLVIAMYETAIRRTQEARECLGSGDVFGRARAISKASNILTELRLNLNPDANKEIATNLDRLYRYMQGRLQDAHVRKTAEPLNEVEKLLSNLLEAWKVVREREEGPVAASSAGSEQAGLTGATARSGESGTAEYWAYDLEAKPSGRITVSA